MFAETNRDWLFFY